MDQDIQVRQSFVVSLPQKEAYAFWRRLENYPKFMKHLGSVEELDAKRSRWVIDGPAGRRMTWESEIVEEDPGRVLAWRTVGRSDVRHGGRVELYEATAGRGTVVCVRMSYEAPARRGRSALARVFRDDPETQIRGDLRRFKQLAETGKSAKPPATRSGEVA
jgi:uncharacterized membrane protein